MVKKGRSRATRKVESPGEEMPALDDKAAKSGESSTSKPSSDAPDGTSKARLPIVGIGASAGGLDAFRKFLNATPEDNGLAIILVPHLDPSHESMMVNLLARQTKIPVCEVEDGMVVQANRVYVIPPNSTRCRKVPSGQD